MSSGQPVHVFPFSDTTKNVYCGNWYGGDGWTVLPDQVTCIDCMKRAVAMALGADWDLLVSMNRESTLGAQHLDPW